MLKRKLIAILICVAVMVCILGCNSLWNVNSGTTVTLDLKEMGLTSNNAVSPILSDSILPRAIDSDNDVDNDNDDTDFNVIISLFNSNTNQIVATQTITLDDDNFDDGLQVTFYNMTVGQSVYATIDITHNAQELLTEEAILEGVKLDDTYFKARSESTVILEEETVLVTKPAAAFFMPYSDTSEYSFEVDYESDSDSTGLTPYEPKTSLNESYKALGGVNAPEGSVIYVMDTIDYDIGQLNNKSNVIIKRFKSSKNLVNITSSFDITLGDVIIDGNKEKLIATAPLISNEAGRILTLDGTTIQNSKVFTNDFVQASAIQVDGQALIINSATIINNEVVDDGSDPTGQSRNGVGGAIFIETEFGGKLYFGSDIITISGNTDKNGENNIFYDIGHVSSYLHNIRATSELHPDSRIGISPYTYDETSFSFTQLNDNITLLISYDTENKDNSNTPYFTLNNFILDIPGNLEIVDSDLVYKN